MPKAPDYVGAIQYAVCGCRIDCCFTVRELAKHMVKPNVKHAAAARHCLQYLLARNHKKFKFQASTQKFQEPIIKSKEYLPRLLQ